MRGLFGMVSLLAALLIVGLLVKQQLDSSSQYLPLGDPDSDPSQQPGQTPADQVQQYKSAVEQALNQQRPMPTTE